MRNMVYMMLYAKRGEIAFRAFNHKKKRVRLKCFSRLKEMECEQNIRDVWETWLCYERDRGR